MLTTPERMPQQEAEARFRREAAACERLRAHTHRPRSTAARTCARSSPRVRAARGGAAQRAHRPAGPLLFSAVHLLGEQLWSAIAELHEIGIIHRDISSTNVLLDQGPDGERLTLLDLGSRKLLPGSRTRSRRYRAGVSAILVCAARAANSEDHRACQTSSPHSAELPFAWDSARRRRELHRPGSEPLRPDVGLWASMVAFSNPNNGY